MLCCVACLLVHLLTLAICVCCSDQVEMPPKKKKTSSREKKLEKDLQRAKDATKKKQGKTRIPVQPGLARVVAQATEEKVWGPGQVPR